MCRWIFTVIFPNKLKESYDKVQCFILFKNHQLLWLWGLAPRNIPTNLMMYAKMQKCLMLGFHIRKVFWSKWVLNFHSTVSMNSLEILSTSGFCVPWMCADDSQIFCDVHIFCMGFMVLLRFLYKSLICFFLYYLLFTLLSFNQCKWTY